MMNLKKLLFQHSEPLRFTQSRWTNGKEANHFKWYQNILLVQYMHQACRPGGAMHKRDRTEPASKSESLYSYTWDSNPTGSLF